VKTVAVERVDLQGWGGEQVDLRDSVGLLPRRATFLRISRRKFATLDVFFSNGLSESTTA
jgi:hypothetical protein